jgi:MYXO-CTERM domain-containing protein
MVDDNYLAWLSIGFVEPGEFVITVQAMDHFDHVTEAQLVVHVVGQGSGTASGTGDSGGSEGEESATGLEDSSGGADGTSGPPIDDDTNDKACGCATRPTAPMSLALVGLLAIAARRRRGVGRA